MKAFAGQNSLIYPQARTIKTLVRATFFSHGKSRITLGYLHLELFQDKTIEEQS